jgi:hypothetical protein
MPRKSLLLLLSIFLIVAPLAKADSINNLTQLDSGQPFTLYGLDSHAGFFILTPESIVRPSLFGDLFFASSIPAGWTFQSGPVTFALSFGGQSFSGVPGVGPCPPNIPCVAFGVGGNLNLSAKTPATLTFTFLGANGGTETANFFVGSRIIPEPQTWLLFGTGAALLGVKYRYRVGSTGRIV